MPRDDPNGNGDWDSHRMHVIAELKRAAKERSDQAEKNEEQHKDICDGLADLKTEMEVTKTRLEARASLFGAGSSALVVAIYLLLQWVSKTGGP